MNRFSSGDPLAQSAAEGCLAGCHQLPNSYCELIRSVVRMLLCWSLGFTSLQRDECSNLGTRAAVIGGADATSNVRAGRFPAFQFLGARSLTCFRHMAVITMPSKPMH